MKAPTLKIVRPTNLLPDFKINYKNLFKELGAGIVSFAVMDGPGLVKSGINMAFSLEVENNPSSVAYRLILAGLSNGTLELLRENIDKFPKEVEELKQLYASFELDEYINNIPNLIVDGDLEINENFFQRPGALSILPRFQIDFKEFVMQWGMEAHNAEILKNRLVGYFANALYVEWRSKPQQYQSIYQYFDTPFSEALKKQLEWENYYAFLNKQADEKIFNETFGLSEIYIPIRAYCYDKLEHREANFRDQEDNKKNKVAFDLESELWKWLESNDKTLAIRIISGGPGSGKSSFAKIFASNVGNKRRMKLLFIPLHHINVKDDFTEAVKKFNDLRGYFSGNVWDHLHEEERFLLILDGLDELAKQGKYGEELAHNFIREVKYYVDQVNYQGLKCFVLISGRELAVQSASTDFRKHNQIIHLLPYYIESKHFKDFQNPIDFLDQDQRNLWWEKYGILTGCSYEKLPVNRSEYIDEITAQPLLNYLLALSIRGGLEVNEDTNLNNIYEYLIKGVFKRQYEEQQHLVTRDLSEESFFRVLEEIAMSAWHGGDARTTTIPRINTQIEKNKLTKKLEMYQSGAQSGVSSLLTAFYFKQVDMDDKGDKTFEFTHKSFGEYLVARRLVNIAFALHQQNLLKDREDMAISVSDSSILYSWVEETSKTPIDTYIYKFIIGEIFKHDTNSIIDLQKSFCNFLSYCINKGLPVEKLTPRENPTEEMRLSRNSGEALLVIANICARKTQKLNDLNLLSNTVFGTWLSRIRPQRTNPGNVLAMDCLSYLRLDEYTLDAQDLYNANLSYSSLKGSQLFYALLYGANLTGCIMHGCRLDFANLGGANLANADLKNANFIFTDLRGASFSNTNIQDAIVRDVILNSESNLLKGGKRFIKTGRNIRIVTQMKDKVSQST